MCAELAPTNRNPHHRMGKAFSPQVRVRTRPQIRVTSRPQVQTRVRTRVRARAKSCQVQVGPAVRTGPRAEGHRPPSGPKFDLECAFRAFGALGSKI